MNVVGAIRAYLLDSEGVTNLVGQRLDAQVIDPKSPLPAADLRLSGAQQGSHLWGRDGFHQGEIIFNCYGHTPDSAHEVAKAIFDSGILQHKGLLNGVDIRGVIAGIGPNDFLEGVDPGSSKYRYGVTISLRVTWLETID